MFKPAGTVAADQYNLYRGMLLNKIGENLARGRCCATFSMRSGRRAMMTLPRGSSNI